MEACAGSWLHILTGVLEGVPGDSLARRYRGLPRNASLAGSALGVIDVRCPVKAVAESRLFPHERSSLLKEVIE